MAPSWHIIDSENGVLVVTDNYDAFVTAVRRLRNDCGFTETLVTGGWKRCLTRIESSISKDFPPHARGVYRARRIAAQFHMGFRYLSKLFAAERRFITLSSNWPEFRP